MMLIFSIPYFIMLNLKKKLVGFITISKWLKKNETHTRPKFFFMIVVETITKKMTLAFMPIIKNPQSFNPIGMRLRSY